ncbi:B12-binding domain-containing radical SAM protein [Planctomycetota bacterium]
MNILLIYPKYPDTFWSFKHVLRFISKKAAFPPLGLLTVASLLPKKWQIKLVDVNISELHDEEIAWADMVFISAMIVQQDSARQIIKRCKALGKIVVAGGPAATALHEMFEDVDHFVLNEAEITLPLFLDDLKKGRPQPVYSSTDRPDITKTPIPQWSLINFKDYATMPVQYSRGCPFDCEFCDIVVMYGRKPRTKTPSQMVREIESLYEAGWRGDVFVVDDNFIGNKIQVKKMLLSLIDWQKKHKYPFAITTEASANLADDKELMQMMSAANFHKVFLGIETPNIDSLKECGKYQNTAGDLEQAVREIQKNGMQVMGGFIVGFDNDTESIFETQIKFIQKVGIVTAMVGLLNALPQTRLWHRLKAEGRLLGQTTGENTDAQLNFIPKMTQEKLLAGYQKILSTIYSPQQYYARINTFISNYKPMAKNKIRYEDLMATVKSMWSIGIRSRARFLYWRLLAKTSLKKIGALPIAIELAIYGLHFEKISNRILSS